MKRFLRLLVLAGLLLTAVRLPAAERIPPVPPRYFNDYAGAVSGATADELNTQLEQYERASSNQLLVAIYPKMESDSSVEDYTVRTAQAWGVGQKGRNNGAVLFVFKDDHKLYLQVGYGLEAVLPDGLAHQIIENEIKPRFRAGDYDGGLRAAVAAMIAATKGEYHGTGRTNAEGLSLSSGTIMQIILFGFFAVFVLASFIKARRQGGFVVMQNPRRRGTNIWLGGGGGFGGGGNFGGGGSFGGGGGFSGGGGSFGGGGAGGSW